MQLFGATYIMWIERLMAGISHQHVLSYNPFLCQKERSLKNGGKQQDEGDAGK